MSTPMTPEDPDFQRRVQRVLLRPEAEREAALDEESGGDPGLRAMLARAVLDAARSTDRDTTRVDASMPLPSTTGSRLALEDEETLVPGEEIVDGSLRYVLAKRLPGGGLGEVWVADQVAPIRRRVAIKFIRSDKFTKANEARFDNERRVLAAFDHPNIARFYDAGRHKDRPWFAMEYIEGLPIDVHCERNGLSVEERIRLVQQVARAVQYAHDREIVHRDIKPGNVLVTGEGTPKLLDFGIAKLVGTKIEGQRGITTDFEPHTEEYASPEQLQAQPSTVRSDVYALGVMLYELLTEQLPYHVKTRVRERIREIKLKEPPPQMSEALEGVSDEDPAAAGGGGAATPGSAGSAGSAGGAGSAGSGTGSGTGSRSRRNRSKRLAEIARRRNTRPDRLIRSLRGDLDNIVAKAMRIEPLRRYGSPESLAADLENHLQGLPVEARPESAAARLSRLLVRNRWVVAGTLVALVAVTASLAASYLSIQNRYLESERQRLASQREVLRKAWQDLGTLDSEAANTLLRSSGQVAQLRETLVALERQAAALCDVADQGPDGVEDWTMLADIRRRLAIIADSPANRIANEGDPVEAARWTEASDAALRSARELAARVGGDEREAVRLLAQNARDRGDRAFHRRGDFAKALDEYGAGRAILDAFLSTAPAGDRGAVALRRERSTLKTKEADLLQMSIVDRMGRRVDVAADFDRLVAARREIVDEYRLSLDADDSPRSRVDLSVGLGRLADVLRIRGDTDGAIEIHGRSLDAVRPALRPDSPFETRKAAADSMLLLGGMLLTRGAAGDLARGSELVEEASRHYVVQTIRAPEESVARDAILRVQQGHVSYLTWDASVRVLRSIRTARLEPDGVLAGLGPAINPSTARQIDSAITRAIRIGNGARLAVLWRDLKRLERSDPRGSVVVRDGSFAEDPERLRDSISAALVESVRVAFEDVPDARSDLRMRIETVICLAIVAHPESAPLLARPDAEGLAERAFAEGRRLLAEIGDPAADPPQAVMLAGEAGNAWQFAQAEWDDTVKARTASP